MDWKVGDWATFERGIVQIKEIYESGGCEVSDGSFSTSGMLLGRLRPLTLRNKRIGEWFAWHYRELDKIRGARGFNYPDINRLFNELCLQATDGPDDDQAPFDKAREFIHQARDYTCTWTTHRGLPFTLFLKLYKDIRALTGDLEIKK